MKSTSSHHHIPVEPISLVFSFIVKKGKEKQFEEWAHEITSAASQFEGHLGSNWIRYSNNSYSVIVKFLDIEDSNRWINSAIRKRLRKKVYSIVKEAKEDTLQNITGLETWFTLPGNVTIKPPPRWKMATVTMIGIYPIGLIYQAYFIPYFRLLPLLLRPIALSLLLTPILTYVIMPQLTKLFRKWLYPGI